MIKVEQVEAWDRHRSNVDRVSLRLESTVGDAIVHRANEIGEDRFDLTEHQIVSLAIEMGARRRVGPAHHHTKVPRAATLDDRERIMLLAEHASGHREI